jgi:membrane associated rhomboid family serine protease
LDRAAVLSGHAWRLLTGHLHGGRKHLMWDVLPLIAIGLLFEEYLGARPVPLFHALGLLAGALCVSRLPAGWWNPRR